MPNLQIGPELIEKWTNGEIWYYLTEEMVSEIDSFRQQVLADKDARGFKEVAFAYEPIIEQQMDKRRDTCPHSNHCPL